MSNTVVCLFPDRDTARRAVEQMAQQGLDPARITQHEQTASAVNATSLQADELVTGGFASNFMDLLRNLLDTPTPEGRAATYEDMVRSEGTLVSITVDDAKAGDDAMRLAREAGAQRASVLDGEQADSFRQLFAR